MVLFLSVALMVLFRCIGVQLFSRTTGWCRVWFVVADYCDMVEFSI